MAEANFGVEVHVRCFGCGHTLFRPKREGMYALDSCLPESCDKCGSSRTELVIRRPAAGSLTDVAVEAGGPYSDDDLIQMLQWKHDEIGRAPSCTHVQEDDRMPSPSTFIRHFGSWDAALEAADLDPMEVQRYSGAKSDLERKLQQGDAV